MAEARTKALEYRKLAREGGNPIEAKRKARTTVPTFAEAAQSTMEQHRAGWKDEKHPAQWINTLKAYVNRGLPRQNEKRGHFNAIPYADVPDFVKKLPDAPTSQYARLGFEFLILTAARTNEVLKAEWTEVDFDKAVWTIPRARMKAGREHRVPLAPRALAARREVGTGVLGPGFFACPDTSFIWLEMPLLVTALATNAKTTNKPRKTLA